MSSNLRSNEERDSITKLPLVVDVPDQPCQQLYERNPVLLGYDVVQYHFIKPYKEGGVAVRGVPEFAYNFEGYQFWFSTKENRDLFIGDPWKYAPAWGGFCSYGIGLELPPRWPWAKDFLGPPAGPWDGWFIQDGVLGFNIWASYTDIFLSDPEVNMEKAKNRWIEMRGKLKAGPFNTHCIGSGPLQNWCLSQQPHPWLRPLPECEVEYLGTNETCKQFSMSGQVVPQECLDEIKITKGGAIVSGHEDFNDFSNQAISPYAVRLIKILASTGFVIFVLILSYCCYRRWSKSAHSGESGQGQNADKTTNDDPEPTGTSMENDKLDTNDAGARMEASDETSKEDRADL